MAILKKKILPENTYMVSTSDGKRVRKKFTKDDLDKKASVTNQMILSGLRIPAPFDHNKEAKPKTEDEVKIFENQPAKAFQNAGYWKRFWTEPDEKGVTSLYAEVDVPGDISDPNSVAWKLKNTNDEVSISFADEFVDGLGRKWSDGILHVAIVNHAVVPNQTPFEEGVTVVNMSMIEPGSNEESIIDELKTALLKVKINLPSSTSVTTFLRDLLVAVNQVQEPTGQLEPAPIYMSIGDTDMALTEAQAKALVDTKAVNPATSQPFTMEDLGFKPKPKVDETMLSAALVEKDKTIAGLTAVANAFKSKFVEDTKATIQKRISDLVASGVVKKEWAEANLVPKVEFQMSISDGKIQDHPLEIVMSALEAQKPAVKGGVSLPEGFVIENNDNPDVDLSDDDIQKALDAMSKDGLFS